MRNVRMILLGSISLVMGCKLSSSESSLADAQSTAEFFVSKDPASDFKKMSWLTGAWQGTYHDKPFYEAWRQPNDSLLVNYEVKISGNDTLVSEGGHIHLRGREVFYGNDSIYWKLHTLSTEEIIFKNDSLPYSRTIYWKHTPEDHWYTKLMHPKGKESVYDLVKVAKLDRLVSERLKIK